MNDKANKLKGIMGIGKKKNTSLEFMFFKKWAEHGFLQSQARSHREEHTDRMRNTSTENSLPRLTENPDIQQQNLGPHEGEEQKRKCGN